MTVKEQARLDNLKIANEVRVANARLKQSLRRLTPAAARQVVAGLILSPSHPSSALPVRCLLLAIPRVGPGTVTGMLVRAGVVSGDRRVRGLTVRQRDRLLVQLGVRSRTAAEASGGDRG